MKSVTTFVFLILALFVTLFTASPLMSNDDSAKVHFQRRSAEVMHQVEAMDLLRRITRQAAASTTDNGTKVKGCKYRKGQWSACDPVTKQRTRTFTLKKGDAAVCEAARTLRKECKVKNKGGKQRNGNQRNRKGGANNAKNQNQQS